MGKFETVEDTGHQSELDEDYEDRDGALCCTSCGIMLIPDDESESEMDRVAEFISEHQYHGEVSICYKNDDGAWVSAGTMTRPS